MVYGWATTLLQGLDIEYRYLPGPQNVQADSLGQFLYEEVSMHTEHVEALTELAQTLPKDYTLTSPRRIEWTPRRHLHVWRSTSQTRTQDY
jgi:hypothetical protein